MTTTPGQGCLLEDHLQFGIDGLKNPNPLRSISPGRLFWLSGARSKRTVMTCTLFLGETRFSRMRLDQAPLGRGLDSGRQLAVEFKRGMRYAQPQSDELPAMDIYKASVEGMTWDEESGRLCLLLDSEARRTADEECPKEIVYIDFV